MRYSNLNEFVRFTLHCSYDEADMFISDFRNYDAVEYGRNILENHEDNFCDGFDIDSVDEDLLIAIAHGVEDEAMDGCGTIEDHVLHDIFGDKY